MLRLVGCCRDRARRILDKALGTAPEELNKPKTKFSKPVSKFGLKGFKPDDRLFCEDTKLENSPKKQARKVAKATMMKPAERKPIIPKAGVPVKIDKAVSAVDTWPAEFSAAAMKTKFKLD